MPKENQTIKEKNDTLDNDNDKNKNSAKTEKGRQGLLNLLAVVTALAIILGVGIGAFFVVVRSNIGGVADTYRKNIQAIPVLKYALPKVKDPEDPQNLTQDELKDKYNELRKKRDELQNQVKKLEDQNSELAGYKQKVEAAASEVENIKTQTEAKEAELEQQTKKLEEDRKKLEQMAALNDKAGFKEFYEKLDKESAKQIYNDIMLEEKLSEDTKKIIQIYEAMEPDAAAKIFEQMGDSGIDTVVKMLTMIKKDRTSEIIAAMSTSYAAKVTVKLTEVMNSSKQ